MHNMTWTVPLVLVHLQVQARALQTTFANSESSPSVMADSNEEYMKNGWMDKTSATRKQKNARVCNKHLGKLLFIILYE